MSIGKLIVLANVKGGTGKSTLSVNLAAIAANDGKKVLLIDTDAPQFNTASWVGTRMNFDVDTIKCAQITTPTIHKSVEDYLKFYDYVIVDCGGRDNPVIRTAMIAAGKVNGILIIPITPSPFDIWATVETLDILSEASSMFDEGIKSYMVLNRVKVGTNLEQEAADALHAFTQKYPVKVMTTNIYDRVDLVNCIKTGQSAIEFNKKGDSAKETRILFNEINGILDGTEGE